MVIKKPCAFPATAGDFNDHPLNTDRGSELHGTCFPGWHTEELVAPKRIFPAKRWSASIHTIRPEHQYYTYKRFWHYHCFPEGLLKEWGTPHSHRKFLPVSLGINQPDWDVFFIRCARIRTGRYYDKRIFETRGQGDTGRLHYPVHLSFLPHRECDNQ